MSDRRWRDDVAASLRSFAFPFLVLLATHAAVRAFLIWTQWGSAGLTEPVWQALMGLLDDVVISSIAAAGLVVTDRALARMPRIALFFRVIGISVLAVLLALLVANAAKVTQVGGGLTAVDLRFWEDLRAGTDALVWLLLAPSRLPITVAVVALLTAFAWALVASLRPSRRHAADVTLPRFGVTLLACLVMLGGLRWDSAFHRINVDEPVENHPVLYLFADDRRLARAVPSRPDEGITRLRASLAAMGAQPSGMPDWPTRNRRAPPGPEHLHLPSGTNVVILAMEGLGAAFLAANPDVAPFTLGLRGESLSLENHLTTMYRTAGAQLGILCGMLDPVDDLVMREHPRAPVRCLPEVLRDAGYSTHWVTGSRGEFDHQREWAARHAFDSLVSHEDFPPETPGTSFGTHDGAYFEHLLAELDGAREPFFAFGLSMSNHHPYEVPDDFLARHPETRDWSELRRSHRYVDEQIELFFKAFRARAFAARTLVVVVGDHPPWGWNELDARHAPDPETAQARYRTVALLNHPALAAARNAGLSSHLDLSPTIAALLGLDVTSDFLGIDLLAPPADRGWIRTEDNARNYFTALHAPGRSLLRGFTDHTCTAVLADGPVRRPCTEDERRAVTDFDDTFIAPTTWELWRHEVGFAGTR